MKKLRLLVSSISLLASLVIINTTVSAKVAAIDSNSKATINGQANVREAVVDLKTIKCISSVDSSSTFVTFGLNITNPQDYVAKLKEQTASFDSVAKTFSATVKGKVSAENFKTSDFVVAKKNLVSSLVTANANSIKTTETAEAAKQELSVKDIAKKSSSVVYVEVYDEDGNVIASGSGFVISSDGKVVTNYHVIDGAYSAKIMLSNGTKYDVQGVYGYDKTADIAILKVNASGLSSVTLGNSDAIELGESVVAIGSPEGLQNTVSTGIVSSIRISNERKGYKDFQISVPINHGSSGGALFNMYGEAVGITYAGYDTTGDLNFAIPINDLNKFINVSDLTTLPKLNGFDMTQQETKYFPMLSDVPQPNMKYEKYETDKSGKTVYYLYDTDNIKEGFFENYAKLLKANGWTYYKFNISLSGTIQLYYVKGKNVVSLTIFDDCFAISGKIH